MDSPSSMSGTKGAPLQSSRDVFFVYQGQRIKLSLEKFLLQSFTRHDNLWGNCVIR